MNILRDFEKELKVVMNSLHERISSYSHYFKKDALGFLSIYNILDEGFSRNPLCFMLPFWLKDPLEVDSKTCCKITEGFMLLAFYVLIQDAVMDITSDEHKEDLLPLGSLFFVDFLEIFREMFPVDSLFWSYFKKYINEWTNSVIWEKKEKYNKKINFSKEELILAARKAAALKISSSAICILGGHEDKVEKVSNIIDLLILTFQMLDDISDWKEDAKTLNCTFFLFLVMEYCELEDLSKVNEIHVSDALYFGGVLEKIFKIVYENHTVIEKESVDFPYFILYHETLYNQLEHELKQIHKEKESRIQGGFIYLLSKPT
jgi:hypothetical protein